jgi:PAS domain S-box-containing protein
MKTKYDILKLIEKIDDDAFIIDYTGSILYSNSTARNSLPANFVAIKFFDLFLSETNEQIEQMLEEVVSYNNEISKEFTIKYSNGTAKECVVKIDHYFIEDNLKIFLIVFSQDKKKIQDKPAVKIFFSNNELRDLIDDNAIQKIIEDIKSNFPFTLIGKNNIQNEINRLTNFFWIKDSEGRYILVNQKFAQSLGFKPSQIEGRLEQEFIPNYLIEFFQSTNNFIKNTPNVIIKEGLPFPYHSGDHSIQIIEIPIFDLDNNVISIIGLTREISRVNVIKGIKSPDISDLVIENLSKPVLILDKNENLERINKKFILLYPDSNFESLIGEHYSVLPEAVKNVINLFIKSNENEAVISVDLKNDELSKVPFVFNLRKLYNSNTEMEGYLIIAEENPINSIISLRKDKGKMYELIMQNSPEPMFVYDADNLQFLDVNPAALDLYGYTKSEFLQMDLTDLYSPDDIQSLLESSQKETNQQKITGPWRHKSKNGTSFFVEISKYPVDDKGKKAFINIIKDITEKVELEKKIQLYKATFENTDDMLFITDAEGFITFTNDKVNSILGYSFSELENRPFITLASDEDRIKINSEIFGGDVINSIKMDAILKTNSNELSETSIISTPILDFNKQIVSYNLIVRPKVEISKNSIKTGSGRKASSGEKGIIVEESFLSSIFHEILTPMNVILGFVQEITENFTNPTAEQKEAVEIIDQNREVLLQTMDSLLEYSHIVQDKIELKTGKFLFTDLLESVHKNTNKDAKDYKIEFAYGKISSSLNIESDRSRLESLLTIFISIAMRITKEKKLYVSAYQYDDKSWFVGIKDSKKDVSKFLSDNVNNIFSIDTDKTKKDFGISKLKLQLLNKLLTILKGKYQTLSKGDEITEIGFVFPLDFLLVEEGKPIELQKPSVEKEIIKHETINDKQEPAVEKTEISQKDSEEKVKRPVELPKVEIVKELVQEEEKKPVAEPKQVVTVKHPVKTEQQEKLDFKQIGCLYVEDLVDSQILFKVQMKELKYIDFAVSFEAALPLLEQKKYDLIVIDINLQGEYNGLDALRIIRKMPGYENVKIIAVTAYVLPGDKEKFIAAGFNDFISKPIMREKLVDSFEKMMALV